MSHFENMFTWVNPLWSADTIQYLLLKTFNVDLFTIFKATSNDLDIKPYEKSPMDLDTYLSDFQRSDEWQILANETIRVATPRELGELLVFSRRTTLR